MKLLCWLSVLLTCGSVLKAQEVPSLSFEELQDRIRNQTEAEVLAVNFWATWCKPCIQELPHFDSLQTTYSPEEVKVLLVSLDTEAAAAAKYQRRKNIQSEVVYLDEVDHNAWIDRISPEWSGAIPATLFITATGAEYFHEGELSAEALFTQVNQLRNPK